MSCVKSPLQGGLVCCAVIWREQLLVRQLPRRDGHGTVLLNHRGHGHLAIGDDDNLVHIPFRFGVPGGLLHSRDGQPCILVWCSGI